MDAFDADVRAVERDAVERENRAARENERARCAVVAIADDGRAARVMRARGFGACDP